MSRTLKVAITVAGVNTLLGFFVTPMLVEPLMTGEEGDAAKSMLIAAGVAIASTYVGLRIAGV